jgi:hypothetical protein
LLLTVALDPKATVNFLQSSHSAETYLCAIEFSKAAIRDLNRPAVDGRQKVLETATQMAAHLMPLKFPR